MMTPDSTRFPLWPAAATALAVILATFAPPAAAASGTAFVPVGLDVALQKASGQSQNVLVEVWATWCPPCKKQKKEVFDTKTGAVLTRNVVAVRLDFDAPENQSLMRRYNVLSLPTVLVLRPDGSEIGRVEGYDTARAFAAAVEPFLAGTDELASLTARLGRATEGSAAQAALRVDVGHAHLVRGDEAEGLRYLEGASIDTSHAAAAQHALFLLGRYYSRAKGDHVQGRHLWRELFVRYPTGDFRLTALWWYAGDLIAMGHDLHARSVLQSAAEADTTPNGALGILVSAVEEHGRFHDVARAVLKGAKLSAAEKKKLATRIDAAPVQKKEPPAPIKNGAEARQGTAGARR